jgi:LysM repeat protein
VQPGDTLGAISEETSVAVADLLAYNDVDAANLRVGQKLKLAP